MIVTAEPHVGRLLRAIADELDQAQASGRSARRAAVLLPGLDLPGAYAVQDIRAHRRVAAGAARVGYTVRLTSAAMQQQMGAFEPEAGVLLTDRQIPTGGTLDRRGLFAPRIEAGLAIRLSANLALQPGVIDVGADYRAARSTITSVSTAVEVSDSPYDAWKIGQADRIAANAGSAWFALGPAIHLPYQADLRRLGVRLAMNGIPQASGRGSDVLGDPLLALVWLARLLASRGGRLRAGDVVLLGGVHASLPLPSRGWVEAVADGLPPVGLEVGGGTS